MAPKAEKQPAKKSVAKVGGAKPGKKKGGSKKSIESYKIYIYKVQLRVDRFSLTFSIPTRLLFICAHSKPEITTTYQG